MTGFQAPNYTQTPNDFFEMARDMKEAELKVTLYIIRETFGYHREEVEVSIRKLAIGAGLTPRNAYNGAEKAIARGTLEKRVSSTNVTTWRAVVGEDTQWVRRGYSTVSPDKGKVTVKESKERERKKNEDEDEEMTIRKKVAMKFISKAYTEEIGLITPMIADELRDAIDTYPSKWIMDALYETASQNKRSWKYVLAILKRWQTQGNQEEKKPVVQKQINVSTKQDQSLANIQSWLSKKQEAQSG
jgi:DnaD/phage-associated family protein